MKVHLAVNFLLKGYPQYLFRHSGMAPMDADEMEGVSIVFHRNAMPTADKHATEWVL